MLILAKKAKEFAKKASSLGMSSVWAVCRKEALHSNRQTWQVIQEVDEALTKMHPRLPYKFFCDGIICHGAFVEDWAIIAINAYYENRGFAGITLAEFLEKTANECN